MRVKANNNSQLSIKAKQEKAQYQREWRQKNKDKQRQHLVNYWEKRALKKEQEKLE